MVYETDFYTTRRPYSRPTITSYSVTQVPRAGLSTWRVKPSIRSSVLIGELDRIYHRPRPHLGYAPLEDYLNSRPLVDFDDETKLIRAETDRLMRRIYTSVPHPRTTTSFHLVPYNGHYADRKISPLCYNSMVDDILSMSYYSEPSARTIGRGHLACVSYAGGRGYPRRKHLFSDEYRDIGDEIRTRSYYNNNYNKAYVDAMSLPTGFASYLLRIKPPEKNGLTNIEKMHILALSEERKKTAEIPRAVDDIITERIRIKPEQKAYQRSNTSIPILRESTKPSVTRTSKAKDEYVKDVPKVEIKKEEPMYEPYSRSEIPEVNGGEHLWKTENLSEGTEHDISIATEKPGVEFQTETTLETSKPEKKEKKPKKSSLSKTSSFSDPKPPVSEEINVKSEDVPSSIETPFENEILETASLAAQDATSEVEPAKPEVVEAEPEETEPPTFESETIAKRVDEPPLEESLPPSVESNEEATESVPPPEEIQAETIEEEAAPLDSQERQEDSYLTVSSRPIELEETQASDSQPSETLPEEEDKLAPKDTELSLNETEESTEVPQEINAENTDLAESTPADTEEEKKMENIPNSPSEADLKHDPEESPEAAPAFVPEVPDSTEEIKDPSTQETTNEEKSEDKDESKIEGTETSLRHSASNEMQNIIEDVTDLGTCDIPKENETEPLIEEPQSPDSLENINEKEPSNVITEVLSDVPEES